MMGKLWFIILFFLSEILYNIKYKKGVREGKLVIPYELLKLEISQLKVFISGLHLVIQSWGHKSEYVCL